MSRRDAAYDVYTHLDGTPVDMVAEKRAFEELMAKWRAERAEHAAKLEAELARRSWSWAMTGKWPD